MRSYGKTDDRPALDGDDFFDQVNMKDDRGTLAPGTLALSINKRLRTRSANTRRGTVRPMFCNNLEEVRIHGAGVFSNPQGDEVLLVAGIRAVHMLADGWARRSVPIPPGTVFDEDVEFVQARNKIFIFRGPDHPQLVWDGASSAGFVTITKKDPDDTSTKLIPPAVTAEHVADRLLIIHGNDNVLATDVGDYTSYDDILEVFYVNSGKSDKIVRVFGYAQGIVIVFKSGSVNLLLNWSGDPTLAQVQLLNSQLDLAGFKAVVMLGGDVLFLSQKGAGIYRIAQAFESRLQAIPLPISEKLQPLIERINWSAAGGAVAAAHGEYVYFAVPIDGSLVNNCMIVYNGATAKLEGYDTRPMPFQVDDLKVTRYQGEQRLFAIDKKNASVYVLDEGRSDNIWNGGEEDGVETEYEIEDVMETRGYAGGDNENVVPGMHRFNRAQAAVATWRPSIEVTSIVDGVLEETPARETPITKDRRKYYLHGKKDFVPSNINDDFDAPLREDYSVDATEGIYLHDGIQLERKQETLERVNLHGRGRWMSLRIASSQGACDVRKVAVESVPALDNRRLAA